MPGYRRLARNHDFTVLWIGQTISELGSRVSMFVLPADRLCDDRLGTDRGRSRRRCTCSAWRPRCCRPASSPTGSTGAGSCGSPAAPACCSYASLVVAGVTDRLTIPHLLVVALLTGAAAGLFAPAEISAVRAVVPAEDLPTALSQNQARQHVASLLGAPLGGALYA